MWGLEYRKRDEFLENQLGLINNYLKKNYLKTIGIKHFCFQFISHKFKWITSSYYDDYEAVYHAMYYTVQCLQV